MSDPNQARQAAQSPREPAGRESIGARYWSDVVRLTISLLVVWFAVSFGAGILLRDTLDQFSIGGAPLGFWFAQQGAIYTFLILIVVYCFAMNRLERKHGIKG